MGGDARDPLDIAEASIREAEAMLAAIAPPPARTAPAARAPRPRPRRETAVAAMRAVPRRVRAVRWTRRQAGGVMLTLAAIPVGWVLSAAAFETEAGLPALAGGSPRAPVPERFAPELVVRDETPAHISLVAHARRRAITVHRRAGGPRLGRLRARRIEGKRVPLVFLVDRRRDGWVRVHLPVRPNLSLGWVRARDVRLRENPFAITIELRRHRLTLRRAGKVVARRRIAVGQSISPTPTGRYFVTDVIRSRDPGGLYGPYSFGLSAHSPVLTSFRGGNGQIGLHGTNEPEALGTDVSAGCIRIGNDTVRAMARFLPLGTPVVIRR